MERVPALTERSIASRLREVRDEDALWGDLRPELCEAVKPILEATMEDELAAQLVAGRSERTPWRRDHRYGSYGPELVTEARGDHRPDAKIDQRPGSVFRNRSYIR